MLLKSEPNSIPNLETCLLASPCLYNLNPKPNNTKSAEEKRGREKKEKKDKNKIKEREENREIERKDNQGRGRKESN